MNKAILIKEKTKLASTTNDIKILEELSKDENYKVRINVAENENTPIEVLVYLSQDEDNEVRCGIAANSNTPVDVLESLSNDENFYIKNSVCKNLNTPIEVLGKIVQNCDDFFLLSENHPAMKKLKSYKKKKLEEQDDKERSIINIAFVLIFGFATFVLGISFNTEYNQNTKVEQIINNKDLDSLESKLAHSKLDVQILENKIKSLTK